MSHVRSSYLARTLLSSTRPPPPHRCLLALINPKPARSPAPQRRNREVFFPFQCAKLTVIPFFFFLLLAKMHRENSAAGAGRLLGRMVLRSEH